MTGPSLTTTSRRNLLARLLLAAIAAPALGARLGSSAGATKKGKNTIASVDKRISNQRDDCELIGGGKFTVTTLPSGTKTTFCKGGKTDGTYCKNTASETSCRCNNTGQDGVCSQALTPGQSSGDIPGSTIAHFQAPASGEEVVSKRPRKKARRGRKRRR